MKFLAFFQLPYPNDKKKGRTPDVLPLDLDVTGCRARGAAAASAMRCAGFPR